MIAGVLAVDMAALLMYNVAGMMVTGHLGAVFRCAARAACPQCSPPTPPTAAGSTVAGQGAALHLSCHARHHLLPPLTIKLGDLSFRTVLETTRTLFVWLVDLLLFYTPLGLGKLGESWTKYSLIQAAG